MVRLILAAGVFTGALVQVDPAMAQSGRWNDITTTSGCGVSEFRNSAAPPVAIWSGACQGGRAQGRGTLEQRSATESDGSYGASRSTGEMVDGYFNGPVEYEDYWAAGGRRPSGVARRTHRYTMGCEAGWGDGCTPRRRETTASVDAGTVPSPYGGTASRIESSNPPGFGMPVAFLHPDTGRPCVTLTKVEARDESNERRHRIVHVLHFQNICEETFSYRARRIPLGEQVSDPDGVSGTGIGPASSRTPTSELVCVEQGDRDACRGFSEWWVLKGNQRTDEFPVG